MDTQRDNSGPDNRPRSPLELRQMLSQHFGYHTCFTCMGWCAHTATACPRCGADQAGWYQRWDGYVHQREALVDDITDRVDARARARDAQHSQQQSPHLSAPPNPNPPGYVWSARQGKFITHQQASNDGAAFMGCLGILFAGCLLLVLFLLLSTSH